MRLSNWQSRLASYVKAVEKKPFEYGDHDCALFAAGCIEAITGRDYAFDYRGKYDRFESAIDMLKSIGGNGISEMVEVLTAQNNFIAWDHPAFAQRGDLALCDDRGVEYLGIIDFTGRYVMIAAQHGITRKPLDCVKKAWSV